MALNGRFNDSAARQFHLHTVADFVIGHGCGILPRAVKQPYSERCLLLGGSALAAAADETSTKHPSLQSPTCYARLAVLDKC